MGWVGFETALLTLKIAVPRGRNNYPHTVKLPDFSDMLLSTTALNNFFEKTEL